MSRLPTGYQEVEYIEKTATGAYIDTGIKGSNKTRLVMEIQRKSAGGSALFGCRDNANGTNGILSWGDSSGNWRYQFNTNVTTSVSTKLNNRVILEIDGTGLKIDGDLIAQRGSVSSAFETSATLPIFAYRDTSTVTATGYGIFWSYKHYEDGSLVRDLIPCIRTSDNEVGMYDLVSNQFYGNSGSGSFTAGPVVRTVKAMKLVTAVKSANLAKIEDGTYSNGRDVSITVSKGRYTVDLSPIETTWKIVKLTGTPNNKSVASSLAQLQTNTTADDPIIMEAGKTYSYSISASDSTVINAIYGADNTERISLSTSGTVTPTFDVRAIWLRVPQNYSDTGTYTIECMLNEGTTALPYEPYGDKTIPLKLVTGTGTNKKRYILKVE